jgi:nitroreductase
MEKNGYMKPEQKAWFISVAETLYGGTQERSLAFAVKNTAFFGMALMLAARDIGLDTHPMDGFDHEGVLREFDISARYFVPLLICVGHFDGRKTLLPRNWRKSYSDIVISTL